MRRNEDQVKFRALSETVHPVRRAESAFALLGRRDEFRAYYEQNRFGDMKISGPADKKKSDGGDGGGSGDKELRSSLSSLTGDDVSLGTDRIFFAKSLPHLCASVVGFSAVEAALELGNIVDNVTMGITVAESSADKKGQGNSIAVAGTGGTGGAV